ncbi:hypothetical protein [Pseudoalteromonas aurantia]|uniref:Uncharacterized protein n=1 Tax=Pseudoalteromonas aurantia TaxID=43654 RepID=A0A5S3V504_9GAMM|nr:hypothetical protein [Pseudoalteromonas aurantia]TMO66190.1 hypothetical protein CWC19_16830 [Pseudoalteromonas aurantia]
MKTVFLILAALFLFSTISWLNAPLAWISIPNFFNELSWVGMELAGLLVGIILVIALFALLSMGVVGLALVVLIGVVLALLFNSIIIAVPLLMLVALGWLLSEGLST